MPRVSAAAASVRGEGAILAGLPRADGGGADTGEQGELAEAQLSSAALSSERRGAEALHSAACHPHLGLKILVLVIDLSSRRATATTRGLFSQVRTRTVEGT